MDLFHSQLKNCKYWYHGTTHSSYINIIKNGIKLINPLLTLANITPESLSYDTNDFGPGFYLTSHYEQAAKWAIAQNEEAEDQPIVMQFNLSTFFDNAKILKFESPNKHYIKNVKYSRLSGYNHPNTKDYDAIFGPVMDGGIGKYPIAIREKYLNTGIEAKRIPEIISYKEFMKNVTINQYYPEKDQLVIINKALLNNFMDDYYTKIINCNNPTNK